MCSSFRYDIPASYPDWILTVPISQAVDFVLLNTPVNIIQASKFKNFVHLSPNIMAPKEIQMQLSVGMKYMFPNKLNTKLFGKAWNDFEERIRWRLYFAFNEPKDKIDLFDLDYKVPRIREKEPPHLPGYLERGLLMGKVFVCETILNVPDQEEDPLSLLLKPALHS